MSATSDPGTRAYRCMTCGWLFRFPTWDGGSVTYHRNIPHPYSLDYDEEDYPQ